MMFMPGNINIIIRFKFLRWDTRQILCKSGAESVQIRYTVGAA